MSRDIKISDYEVTQLGMEKMFPKVDERGRTLPYKEPPYTSDVLYLIAYQDIQERDYSLLAKARRLIPKLLEKGYIKYTPASVEAVIAGVKNRDSKFVLTTYHDIATGRASDEDIDKASTILVRRAREYIRGEAEEEEFEWPELERWVSNLEKARTRQDKAIAIDSLMHFTHMTGWAARSILGPRDTAISRVLTKMFEE